MENKKESSYSKMKRKYEEKIEYLRRDILVLIQEDGSIKSEEVRLKWKHIIAIENTIWYGSPIPEFKPNE